MRLITHNDQNTTLEHIAIQKRERWLRITGSGQTIILDYPNIPARWEIETGEGTIPARSYFADDIRTACEAAADERAKREAADQENRRRQKELAAFQRLQEQAEEEARRRSFDALPVVETVTYRGRPCIIKWHEGRLWLLTETLIRDITDGFSGCWRLDFPDNPDLIHRLKRKCPEYAAYRANVRAQRKRQRELRAFEKLHSVEQARVAAEEGAKERARYWSSTEILALNIGWTRYKIRKHLGPPDKIEEFSTGYGYSRKDVTRYLWLKEKVKPI